MLLFVFNVFFVWVNEMVMELVLSKTLCAGIFQLKICMSNYLGFALIFAWCS